MTNTMRHPAYYFDLSDPLLHDLISGFDCVWDVVIAVNEIVEKLVGGKRVIDGHVNPGAIIDDGPVYIDSGAVIEPGAYIMTPSYIGPRAVVRHGAYVRPHSAILDGAILGHASEIKSSLMFPGAQAPHFAYVGDSILGSHVNLGAGTKLSNVPVTSGYVNSVKQRANVQVKFEGDTIDTGTRKLGAVLGDEVQTGCNSVLNPGTFIGRRCMVYPNTVVAKGFYESDTILKLRQTVEIATRRYE